jgi:hypothetical protein
MPYAARMLAPVGGSRLSRWSVATAVATLLGVSGCAGPVPPTVPPSLPVALAGAPTVPAAQPAAAAEPIGKPDVAALAERLNTALQSGDVDQWLANFALDDEEDLQRERDWFAGVHAVPMDVREVHLTGMQSHSSATRLGPQVDVVFRHQVRGADPVPALEQYRVRIDRRDGEVKVVEANHVRSAQTGYPQLWDLGPIEVRESGAVVVLTQENLVEEVEEMLPALDAAAAAVLQDFPVPEVTRMVVTIAGEDEFGEIVAETGAELAGVAQVLYTAEEVGRSDGLSVLEGADAFAVRLHLDHEYAWDEWEYYGSELTAGSPLLRHEAVHLAMTMTEPEAFPPSWAAEGFAGWYEMVEDEALREDHLWWLEDLVGDEPADGLPPRLPRSFYTDDEDEISRNYAESAAVFLYVEDAYGREATVDLGLALNALQRPNAELDDLLGAHLDLSTEEFERGYLDWLAANLG